MSHPIPNPIIIILLLMMIMSVTAFAVYLGMGTSPGPKVVVEKSKALKTYPLYNTKGGFVGEINEFKPLGDTDVYCISLKDTSLDCKW